MHRSQCAFAANLLPPSRNMNRSKATLFVVKVLSVVEVCGLVLMGFYLSLHHVHTHAEWGVTNQIAFLDAVLKKKRRRGGRQHTARRKRKAAEEAAKNEEHAQEMASGDQGLFQVINRAAGRPIRLRELGD